MPLASTHLRSRCTATLSFAMIVLGLSGGGCRLFELGAISCQTDEDCPRDMRCGPASTCGERDTNEGDAAVPSDGGSFDLRAVDAPGIDGGGTDLASADGARADVGAADASMSDTSALDSSVRDLGRADAGAVDLAPRSPIPDSPTVYCQDDLYSVSDFCPLLGEQAFGQDGNYLLYPSSYTLAGDAVHDTVTELDWQPGSSPSPVTFSDAELYCQSADWNGDQDWRVPSHHELLPLIDFGQGGRGLALGALFAGTEAAVHWTSTWSAVDGKRAVVPLDRSEQGVFPLPDTELLFVKCVRGTAPVPGDLVNYGSHVFDPRSGLFWQQALNPSENWVDALYACEHLSLGPFGDWRLPNVKELMSVLNYDDDSPPILFPQLTDDESGAWRMTSTPRVGNSGIWVVDVDHGFPRSLSSNSVLPFRCVRGPEMTP